MAQLTLVQHCQSLTGELLPTVSAGAPAADNCKRHASVPANEHSRKWLRLQKHVHHADVSCAIFAQNSVLNIVSK